MSTPLGGIFWGGIGTEIAVVRGGSAWSGRWCGGRGWHNAPCRVARSSSGTSLHGASCLSASSLPAGAGRIVGATAQWNDSTSPGAGQRRAPVLIFGVVVWLSRGLGEAGVPYTSKWLREQLWSWGDAVKYGYHRGHVPADPDTPRLSVHFGPRLPCHAEYLDICRAFAALHPATRGLSNAGDMAWWAHSPSVSRQQQVLWLYYIGDHETDAWGAAKFRQDWRAMSPEARTLLLDLEAQHPGRHVLVDDLRGDDLIAARLRVSRRTVYYDRNDAINRMVAFLQPQQPSVSAA